MNLLCRLLLFVSLLQLGVVSSSTQGAVPDAIMIAPGALSVVAIAPKSMLGSTEYELFPREIAAVETARRFGIDVEQIELAVYSVSGTAFGGPMPSMAAIRFVEPYDHLTAFASMRRGIPQVELQGRPAWSLDDGPFRTICFVHDRLIMIGNRSTIEAALSRSNDAKYRERVAPFLKGFDPGNGLKAALFSSTLRPMVTPLLNQPASNRSVAAAKVLVDDVNTVVLTAGFDESTLRLDIQLECAERDAAQASALALKDLIAAGAEAGRDLIASRLGGAAGTGDRQLAEANARYFQRILNALVRRVGVNVEQSTVRLTAELPMTTVAVASGVATLLPAVEKTRDAARLAQSKAVLRQFAIAYFALLDRPHMRTPFSISADGKPLLSWRVHYLPLIGQDALYGRFRLDEPWDSPHNRKLLSEMPDLYARPGITDEERTKGLTHFQATTGPGTLWDDARSVNVDSQKDSSSETTLFVEADEPVEWTKPADFRLDPQNPLRGLGGLRGGEFLLLMADGSVIQLTASQISPETIKALFTHSGGESVRLR